MTEAETLAKALRRYPAQRALLSRVVKTNGGGRNAYLENRKTWAALYDKGLVQGKMNDPAGIVHTRLGLDVHRILEAKP